jgi:hypothetical protein
METQGKYTVDRKKKQFFPSRFVKRLPTFDLYASLEDVEPIKAFKIFSMEDKSIFLSDGEEGFELILSKLVGDKFIEIPDAFIFLNGFDIKLVIDRLNSIFFHWKREQKQNNPDNNS